MMIMSIVAIVTSTDAILEKSHTTWFNDRSINLWKIKTFLGKGFKRKKKKNWNWQTLSQSPKSKSRLTTGFSLKSDFPTPHPAARESFKEAR